MTDTRDGIAAELAAAGAGQAIAERLQPAESGDLFAPHAGAAAPAEAGDEALPLRPARGRPPGARNRRTVAVAEYIQRRYGDPLEGLAAIAMGSIAETAKAMHDAMRELTALGVPCVNAKGEWQLGIDLNEVVKLKVKAAEAMLPYIHARRAPTDERGVVQTPVLNIMGIVGATAEGGGVSPEDFVDLDPKTGEIVAK